eukprot:m.227555 g.227555  ORF g.227555 m.227555 type:complete len:230 (+) comp15181_c0_seq3:540-1229(+)
MNLHPSLLPRYRGSAPLHHVLLNGDTRSGVSVIELSKRRFDHGRVLHQEQFDVDDTWLYKDLFEHSASVGAEAVLNVLQDFENRLAQARPQDSFQWEPSLAPKVTKNDKVVDFAIDSAEMVRNKQRAFSKVRCMLQGLDVLITGTLSPLHEPVPSIVQEALRNAQPGAFVCGPGKKVLWIKCADTHHANKTHGSAERVLLPVTQLQLPTRASVGPAAFLNQLSQLTHLK